jgi:formylmethanofuran dehydrogenase subunit C
MSDIVVLTPRASDHRAIDLDGITPDRMPGLEEPAIAALPIRVDGQPARLGDAFRVSGGGATRLRIEGDLRHCHGIGAGTRGGGLLVIGDCGDRVGAAMAGGAITVRGSAGHEAGLSMSGGVLRVTGNAGDRVGAAQPGAAKGMTGGELIVDGNVGAGVAARLRRGLVVVGGSTGAVPGRAMIAGTLVVFDRVGPQPVEGSKRGSLVALGHVQVPATYTYACTYEPGFIRLLMTHLSRRHGMAIAPRILEGSYRRYCGDAAGIGKGEILHLVDGH